MVSRRQFLQAGISGVLVGVAGCSSDSSDPTSPTKSPTEAATVQTAETTSTVTPDTVADWIGEESVPLGSTDPAKPLSTAGGLGTKLAESTVVGLGESTHGTQEFFQLKHRLLRYMVEEVGTRVLAWEAGFSEAMAIDSYIRTGEGDPAAALEGFYWAWSCQAFLSMIEWLRSFNAGREPADQVRFYGVDVQSGKTPARQLRTYLDAADAAVLEEVATDLETLETHGFDDEGEPPLKERLSMAEALVSKLQDAFDQHEQAYITATSSDAYLRTRRVLWELARAREYNGSENREASSKIRDQSMAANVRWIREHEAADSIVVSAHNAHIGTNPELYTVAPMGTYLRDEYGNAYYPLGLEFGQGSFRSKSMASGDISEFTLEPPREGTLWATLSAVNQSPFGIDFTSIDRTELTDWLTQRHQIHDIGTVFNPNWMVQDYTDTVSLTESFDGFLFLSESTATRPI